VKDLAALAMVWFGFWCLNKRRSLFIANEKLSECYYFELFIPNMKIRSFYNWDRCNLKCLYLPTFFDSTQINASNLTLAFERKVEKLKGHEVGTPPSRISVMFQLGIK
jgi:hypothetical protein